MSVPRSSFVANTSYGRNLFERKQGVACRFFGGVFLVLIGQNVAGLAAFFRLTNGDVTGPNYNRSNPPGQTFRFDVDTLTDNKIRSGNEHFPGRS